MRRWLVGAAIALPLAARADTWKIQGEAGAEVDTNVQRVETGPGVDATPVESGVFRVGARADGRGKLAGGTYVASMSDLTRIVTDDSVSVENVTLASAELRWMHPLGDRPVSLGAGAVGADALPISDPIGARTFSNVGGDLLLSAHDGDDKRLLLAIGGRSFEYKPDHTFDWSGPTASARLDYVPWQSPEGARSLELALVAGVEARAYDSAALVDACPPNAAPDPTCSSPAPSLLRRDRFERVGVEATWVGKQVASIGYQLIVIDSNSYGQSLVRHRATGSVTSALGWDTFGTVLAILQIDRYLDGIVVGDINQRDFTNIQDDNVSSLQIRIAKKLTAEWSLEARGAIWRNIGSTGMSSYERELASVGVVYLK